ncbi:hypothetical protein H8593_004266 [Salmonella enterica subsp. enterica serovar Give]|nr:hypothetical protein [Salmonella enterica subsp. enterica serovar Give]
MKATTPIGELAKEAAGVAAGVVAVALFLSLVGVIGHAAGQIATERGVLPLVVQMPHWLLDAAPFIPASLRIAAPESFFGCVLFGELLLALLAIQSGWTSKDHS